MKVTYSVASSQDGFIAREDGDVSWLDEMNVDTADTDLEQFFHRIDGLVMGRGTYDFVFNYGSWPYEDKPAWVCTRNDIELLAGANLVVAAKIEDAISQARTRGFEHLWLVGGGKLASSFLTGGWLTHLSICELPIQLKRGIPLFADHRVNDIPCKHRQVVEHERFRQIEIAIQH